MTHMITQSKKTINGIELKTPPLIDPPPRTTLGEPPKHITVVFVWWGNLYPVKYVENLRNSIKRNLSIPYKLYCITERNDVPDGVIKIPTPNKNKGWWQKVNLFHPELFDSSQRILYLDLDVIVVGSLDKIASVQEPFCMIENYGPNKRHAAHNSSVMVWTPTEKTHRIYTTFSLDVMKELHGDQCYIWRVRGNNIWNFPKSWIVSYKYSKLSKWNHIGKDTSVFVFHGNPKPAQIKDYPREHWK